MSSQQQLLQCTTSPAELHLLLGCIGTGLAPCPAAAPQVPGLQDTQEHSALMYFSKAEWCVGHHGAAGEVAA
jgi:hypothetical protein